MKQKSELRLAITDWDYSWLLRVAGVGEDEFHLLPRRMAELTERGFNALRVDVWPHLIAPGRHEEKETEEFVILPHRQRDSDRGSREVRQIQPRERLLRLAQAAQDAGISLWLTSWFLPDTQARRSQLRNPEDFVRVWHATLEWLRSKGALAPVVALDFAHRFPDQPAGYGAWQHVFHRPPQWAKRAWRAGTPKAVQRINRYLNEIPQQLRTMFPQLHYGLSMAMERAGQVRELDVSELDFLDLHLTEMKKGARVRTDELSRRLAEHQSFCRLHQLQPALTGGSHLLSERKPYVPELCRLGEQGVEEALVHGVQVINPSHYARPQDRLWDEAAWFAQLNRHILTY